MVFVIDSALICLSWPLLIAADAANRLSSINLDYLLFRGSPLMMPVIPTLLERDKEYYALDFSSNLPPGTDTVDQLDNNQRQPRPPSEPHRSVPEWPPEEERKGKWISAYLNTVRPFSVRKLDDNTIA